MLLKPTVASASQLKAETVARTGVVSLLLLSLGHCFVDLYSGALGALQPLLVSQFHLSLSQAGVLGGLLAFSSSVMQPVYGYISDRLESGILAGCGPALAGLFISSLGLAPNYGGLLAMVILGGVGIAAFHPQASSRVSTVIEGKRGRSMAIFISAGSVGLAIGPLYFSVIAGTFGLRHMYWAALPGIIVGVLLLFFLPRASGHVVRVRSGHDWNALKAVWKPLSILYTLVFIRSIVQITFTQFIPLYLHVERGYSLFKASSTLSAYLLAGAVGGFLGGHLSDRFGGRLVIIVSMIGSVPFLILFFVGRGFLSELGLVIGGLVLLFSIPVNVVMAQELVPSQAGTVSALMMGFAWGTAGLVFIPFTGWASEMFSMHHVLLALSAFPLAGFVLALRLPK